VRRKRRTPVRRISSEAVQLYRRVRELEADGVGPQTREEYREARNKLTIRVLNRRPWQCDVIRFVPADLLDTRPDYDSAGAAELRRQLDAAITA
jgi:hypothetical protein